MAIDVVGAGTTIDELKEQDGYLVLSVTRTAPEYLKLEPSDFPAGLQHYLVALGDRLVKRDGDGTVELARTDDDDGGTMLAIKLVTQAEAEVVDEGEEEGGESQASDGSGYN